MAAENQRMLMCSVCLEHENQIRNDAFGATRVFCGFHLSVPCKGRKMMFAAKAALVPVFVVISARHGSWIGGGKAFPKGFLKGSDKDIHPGFPRWRGGIQPKRRRFAGPSPAL
jgi:hypothetical protein